MIERLSKLILAQIVVERVSYRLDGFLSVLPLQAGQLLDDVLGKEVAQWSVICFS